MDATLTSCTLFSYCHHFWVGATAKQQQNHTKVMTEWKKWATGQSYIREEVTSYKIHTLEIHPKQKFWPLYNANNIFLALLKFQTFFNIILHFSFSLEFFCFFQIYFSFLWHLPAEMAFQLWFLKLFLTITFSNHFLKFWRTFFNIILVFFPILQEVSGARNLDLSSVYLCFW